MAYSTIRELVIDACASEGNFPSYEKLTKLVLDNFPTSKWQRTHYSWYKSKIKNGLIPVPGYDSLSADITEDDEYLDDAGSDSEDIIESSLSLERDLHLYLARHIADIESELTVIDGGIEYQTDAGRIDILCKDSNDEFVVIELKAGKAKDAALGQVLGYIGCLKQNTPDNKIRGIIVAADFEKRLIYAAKELPHIKLFKYQFSLHLQEIT